MKAVSRSTSITQINHRPENTNQTNHLQAQCGDRLQWHHRPLVGIFILASTKSINTSLGSSTLATTLDMRLYADAKAVESANAIGALAYTLRQVSCQARDNIHRMITRSTLMAHKLMHVIQLGKGVYQGETILSVGTGSDETTCFKWLKELERQQGMGTEWKRHCA
jgi:hypothetical protein